jgi:hypothetical protein
MSYMYIVIPEQNGKFYRDRHSNTSKSSRCGNSEVVTVLFLEQFEASQLAMPRALQNSLK